MEGDTSPSLSCLPVGYRDCVIGQPMVGGINGDCVLLVPALMPGELMAESSHMTRERNDFRGFSGKVRSTGTSGKLSACQGEPGAWLLRGRREKDPWALRYRGAPLVSLHQLLGGSPSVRCAPTLPLHLSGSDSHLLTLPFGCCLQPPYQVGPLSKTVSNYAP